MTKLWVDNAHTAVTLLEIVPQEVVRYKTSEKDGYEAAIIGVGKKNSTKKKGKRFHTLSYKNFDVMILSNQHSQREQLFLQTFLKVYKQLILQVCQKERVFHE
jgi:ribosomal protein L3